MAREQDVTWLPGVGPVAIEYAAATRWPVSTYQAAPARQQIHRVKHGSLYAAPSDRWRPSDRAPPPSKHIAGCEVTVNLTDITLASATHTAAWPAT